MIIIYSLIVYKDIISYKLLILGSAQFAVQILRLLVHYEQRRRRGLCLPHIIHSAMSATWQLFFIKINMCFDRCRNTVISKYVHYVGR